MTKRKLLDYGRTFLNLTKLTVILGQHRSHTTVNMCMGTVRHSTDPDTPGWGHIIKQWVRLYAHLSPLSGSADPPHPSWRSLSSRRLSVNGGFSQICIFKAPDFWKLTNLSRTTRKFSGATSKLELLPARPYWKLLELQERWWVEILSNPVRIKVKASYLWIALPVCTCHYYTQSGMSLCI